MILNETFLRQYAAKRQVLFESISHMDEVDSFDIFISHSTLDKECTLALLSLLKENGINAYVDFVNDHDLNPNQVNYQTAQRIKKRLDQSKALAYIATKNTVLSKWCPWELGYADGSTNGKCVIFPIEKEKSDNKFDGQEFLGLYPYIVYEKVKGTETYKFWVFSADQTEYSLLTEWLENGKMTKFKK